MHTNSVMIWLCSKRSTGTFGRLYFEGRAVVSAPRRERFSLEMLPHFSPFPRFLDKKGDFALCGG